jgi:radical SAM superfamily enzyme YgiQ (UPF0313 family)
MFGGKGKFVDFFSTGDELFDIMCQLEKAMKINSFFVMDENFLLHRKRALRLLELMQQHEKMWALNIFSSANAIKLYKMEELVGLGVSWIWMGLEGQDSQYNKLEGTQTRELVRNLQENGIRVLGSTIIGLEEHTPANIDTAIDYAVSHDVDFHQFMLYTPVPGTPLYAELAEKGLMIDSSEIAEADVHGQYRFNYRHSNIPKGQETEFLLRAFARDFEVNGPSVLRAVRTTLLGHRKYKNHPEKRIRNRFAWEAEGMPTFFGGSLWAAKKWFKNDPKLQSRLDGVLQDLYEQFGLKAKLLAPLIGRLVFHLLKREDRRLAQNQTYEPPTFYEKNYQEPVTAGTKAAGLLMTVAAMTATIRN